SEAPERVEIDLGLACDHADIFEVRGYPRPARGEFLPTAIDGGRVTFRYRGLDGCERSTFVAFSEPGEVGAPKRSATAAAALGPCDPARRRGPATAAERGSRTGRAIPGRRRALVRNPLRARRPHHVHAASGVPAAARGGDARGPRCAAGHHFGRLAGRRAR